MYMYTCAYTYKYLSPNNFNGLGTNMNAKDFCHPFYRIVIMQKILFPLA